MSTRAERFRAARGLAAGSQLRSARDNIARAVAFALLGEPAECKLRGRLAIRNLRDALLIAQRSA